MALAYEPAEAQALLDAAGWRDADGDGVREKNGQPFRFTAIVWNDDGLAILAEVVQARLRRIGVAMEIQLLDNALVLDRLGAGKFEAAFMFHKFTAEDQRKYFGAGNPIGYRSPAVAELIERLVATADPDETDRLYRALTEIYRVDLPVTWLVPWTTTFFAHRRVRGLRMSTHAEPTQYLEELWLEEEGR